MSVRKSHAPLLGGQRGGPNWTRTFTPEQRRRARKAIDDYEPNVAGMFAHGRWDGWSVYYMPTTGTPTYIEMRKRESDGQIIHREVVWDTRKRP